MTRKTRERANMIYKKLFREEGEEDLPEEDLEGDIPDEGMAEDPAVPEVPQGQPIPSAQPGMPMQPGMMMPGMVPPQMMYQPGVNMMGDPNAGLFMPQPVDPNVAAMAAQTAVAQNPEEVQVLEAFRAWKKKHVSEKKPVESKVTREQKIKSLYRQIKGK